MTLVCDHCGWEGDASDLTPHPRLGCGVCPPCWFEGFDTRPRETLGALIEALAPPDPPERTPKRLIDWSDDEFEIAQKVANARAAHERSDVRLRTSIAGVSQLGFGFMRPEFRVAPRKPEVPKPRRRVES